MTAGEQTEVDAALAEVAAALAEGEAAVATLADEILAARRIAVYGVGREGLMMRALCMRLTHLGLDAHVVGEMTVPAIGAGDLLLLSAGPGEFGTVASLQRTARDAGARTLVVTAQPDGPVPRAADAVVHLRARTMADDLASPGVLPMGSGFEAAELLLFDLLSLELRERTGESAETMRSRHTNLE